MAAIPVLGIDSLPNIPFAGPYPTSPLGPSKLRNRRWRINRDSWLVQDASPLHGIAARSVSTSAVPILHQQMRNASIGPSPRPKVLKSSNRPPRSPSYFSGYYEDTSHYILHNSTPRRACTNSSIIEADRQDGEHARVVELGLEFPHSASTRPAAQLNRHRPVYSGSKSQPAMPSLPDKVSLSVARKPVASTSPKPGKVVGIRSDNSQILARQEDQIFTNHMVNVKYTLTSVSFPTQSSESTHFNSPPRTPSLSPVSIVDQVERGTASSPSSNSACIASTAGASLNKKSSSSQESLVFAGAGGVTFQNELNLGGFTMLFDPFPYFFSIFGYAITSITTENLENVRNIGVLCMKILILLYLAACMWNVVAAIHDAVVKAFEPFLIFWTFLNWMAGE
jgi:hypothetical protein